MRPRLFALWRWSELKIATGLDAVARLNVFANRFVKQKNVLSHKANVLARKALSLIFLISWPPISMAPPDTS